MTNMEGLLHSAQASLDANREDEKLVHLQVEIVHLAERLEEVREEARQTWGVQFMMYAMEDYKAQFGDDAVPDTIAAEGEDDEEASQASTESVPPAE
jgi:hypothetical protein